MITKRALTPGRGIMNEVAESLLTKSEMTTFTYYITRYEHNQISVESLVESLLKLLNTEKKVKLIYCSLLLLFIVVVVVIIIVVVVVVVVVIDESDW